MGIRHGIGGHDFHRQIQRAPLIDLRSRSLGPFLRKHNWPARGGEDMGEFKAMVTMGNPKFSLMFMGCKL